MQCPSPYFCVFTGQVVFADSPDGSKNITLRTHHILIEDGAALHIGAPKCRYRSHATVALMGRSDSATVPETPGLGRKFIGVMGGGTLELHGTERVSWTLLTRSVPASGLSTGGYAFQRNFSRGINLRVIDQDTAAVLFSERFDTHDSRNDSQNLTRLLLSLPAGRIVTLAVGDSAVKSLLDETKKAIAEKLGSSFVYNLKYRYVQRWNTRVSYLEFTPAVLIKSYTGLNLNLRVSRTTLVYWGLADVKQFYDLVSGFSFYLFLFLCPAVMCRESAAYTQTCRCSLFPFMRFVVNLR